MYNYSTPIMTMLAFGSPRLVRLLFYVLYCQKKNPRKTYTHIFCRRRLGTFPVTNYIQKHGACRLYSESHDLPTDLHPHHGRVRRVHYFLRAATVGYPTNRIGE